MLRNPENEDIFCEFLLSQLDGKCEPNKLIQKKENQNQFVSQKLIALFEIEF